MSGNPNLSLSLDEIANKGKRPRDERGGGGGGGSGGGGGGGRWQGGGGGGGRWQGGGGGGSGYRGGGGGYSGGGGGGGGYSGGGGGYRGGGGGGGGYSGGHKRFRGDGGGHGGGGGPAPKGEKLDDEGYLWFDAESGNCTYFQDRRRKWPFTTSALGRDHLQALVAANAALRKRNESLLAAAGEDPARVAQEGERLYVEKPTLRGDANVTWSYDEYGHPGLQLYYLKLKSWQRFTETYALLERAWRRGLFDAPLPEGRPLRVAALGGGPGYELLAAQRFFTEVVGAKELELINTDVQPTWREYSEALGFKFHVHDITAGGLDQLVGQEIDYVIVSYVCIYVAKNKGDPVHEATCDEWKRLLDGGVRALLVSERSEETAACGMMEARGVPVERLIEQSLGKDERQSLFLSPGAAPLPRPRPSRADDDRELTFTNVPFEEHKVKRGGAAGAGGSQTKWYS